MTSKQYLILNTLFYFHLLSKGNEFNSVIDVERVGLNYVLIEIYADLEYNYNIN